MYAFSNPAVYIDLNGNAATPLYSQTLTDQALQIQPIGTINTGSQFADDFLSGGASIVNLALTVPNGLLNGLSLPSRIGGFATNQTAEQFDNQVGGLINSTGPVSPFLQIGALPFRTASSLSKVAVTAKLNRAKGVITNTRTSNATDFGDSDIPKINSGPLPADTITTDIENLEKVEDIVSVSSSKKVIDAAKSEADLAQKSRPQPGAAGALKIDDKIFTGRSHKGKELPKFHPDVQEALDNIPVEKRSRSHGRCTEPGCISDALDEGVDPRASNTQAEMNVRKIRKESNPDHNTDLKPCATCGILLDKFNIKPVE